MREDKKMCEFEQLIQKSLHEITEEAQLKQEFKDRLFAIQGNTLPMTRFQRFMEREICIPFIPISLAMGGMVLACGIIVSTLLLPREVKEFKYELYQLSPPVAHIMIKGSE